MPSAAAVAVAVAASLASSATAVNMTVAANASAVARGAATSDGGREAASSLASGPRAGGHAPKLEKTKTHGVFGATGVA